MWGKLCLIRMHLVCLFLLPLFLLQPAEAASEGDIYFVTGRGDTGWDADSACSASARSDENYSYASSGGCYKTLESGRISFFTSYSENTCGSLITNPNHICYGDPPAEFPETGTGYSGDASIDVVSGMATDPDGCSLVPVYKPTYCDYPGASNQECLKFNGY